MLPVPLFIKLFFGVLTLATVMLLHHACKHATLPTIRNKATNVLLISVGWLTIQSVITLSGVYFKNPYAMPPKILLFGLLPALLTIVLLFVTRSGKLFVDSLPLATLTYLHIIRIPVEMVLLWLYLEETVPQVMTFEGRNFDIVSGITAPFVAYFGVVKHKLNRKVILVWNLLALALLLNIIIIALQSTPSPFQVAAQQHSNIAVLYFPFSWLPGFIVPVVLFSQLAAIRQLIRNKPYNAPHT